MIGLPNHGPDILAAIEAGVAGYELECDSLHDLMVNVKAISAGEARCSAKIAGLLFRRIAERDSQRRRLNLLEGARLTHRELEIIALIEQELSNKKIALRLSIEVQTVKNHVHNVLEKLRVRGRREAARYVREKGLLPEVAGHQPRASWGPGTTT